MTGVAVLALVGITADLALGHGGEFQGPAGSGGQTFGGPAGGSSGGGTGGSTGGGGGTGGSTAGSGGTGGTTPPGGGPPRPGGGAGRGGGGGRGGATPGGGKKGDDDRTHDWDWWWELNDDQYLKIKAAVRAADRATSDGDALFGKSAGGGSQVTTRKIRTEILPAVRSGMADPFYDAQAGAVIAAGKIVDRELPELPEVYAEIMKLLANDNRQVQESACLGLGILGSKDAVPHLIAIMKNDPKARVMTGHGTKDIFVRQRAFAAIAIGLIGAQDAVDVPVVSELVEHMKNKQAHPDLQVFPALALGIMRSKDAVPELQKLVKDQDVYDIIRAHAVIALGKLGDKSSVGFLVKDGLTDKSTHVQRSSAIALGLLTDQDDEKTVETLITNSRSAADRAVRNFALIALGQIGNMKGRDHLVFQLDKGNQHDRTFAALALGVYGSKFRESRTEIGNAVLAKWKETKSDSERGAYAIALGLLGHQPAAAALAEELRTGGSPDLKGHVATALGLMGHRDALPAIQDLARSMSDLDTQRRASIALGLMGDPGAVKLLVKVIQDAGNNLAALGGAAMALGFIGDGGAVETLRDILVKRAEFKDNARAFAAVSLGILGDKSDLPLLSKVQENCNYLAATDSLAEILTIY